MMFSQIQVTSAQDNSLSFEFCLHVVFNCLSPSRGVCQNTF